MSTLLQIQKSLGIKPSEIKPDYDLVVKMIQCLLQAGISPDQPSVTLPLGFKSEGGKQVEDGMTPLMKLCSMQINSKVASEVGPSCDRSLSGRCQAIKTRLKIARVLLEARAKVNEVDDVSAAHFVDTDLNAERPFRIALSLHHS